MAELPVDLPINSLSFELAGGPMNRRVKILLKFIAPNEFSQIESYLNKGLRGSPKQAFSKVEISGFILLISVVDPSVNREVVA